MQTRMKTFASTAMAVVLASVKTVVNPSVAFAGDIGMSFKDRVAMEMNSGCAHEIEVRDPSHLAAITGKDVNQDAFTSKHQSHVSNAVTGHSFPKIFSRQRAHQTGRGHGRFSR